MLRSRKRGFTLVELLVVIGVIVFLVVLLIPALQAPRVLARRSACTNNLKQIGRGLQNFEKAKRHFPGSSSKKWTSASIGSDTAGYSWMTMILPYMEENNLYKRLDLKQAPWNDTGITGSPSVLSEPNHQDNADKVCHSLVWSTELNCFLCSSRTLESNRVTPSPYPDTINHAAGPDIDTTPAATSYVALSATHFASLARTEEREWAGGKQHPNGTMYPGSKTSIRSVQRDGLANTAIVCETKEPTYSAWYEGATAGVVGLKNVTGFEQAGDGAKYGVPIDGVVALNYGDPDKNQYYCDGDGPFTSISKWTYGPSSDHPGVILHLFADGSVHAFTASISPTVYMHLITRAGDEPVDLDK